MTQGTLLPAVRVYGIDASSIMELDDAHKTIQGQSRTPPAFTPTEREAIWSGLEDIAEHGRLKLLDKIRGDLQRMYPQIVPKLDDFPHMHAITNMPIRRVHQKILAKHPRIMAAILRTNIDDADPYLVAAACVHKWTVVTEEKRNNVRRSRSKDVPIPDVCDGEGVECFTLRKVAEDEGWI